MIANENFLVKNGASGIELIKHKNLKYMTILTKEMDDGGYDINWFIGGSNHG